jgi:uncharacterized membrane protein
MIWLVLGVVVWSAVHLFPSAGAGARARLVERLGQAYQGVFALAILASVGLMVLGWRSTPPAFVYAPPAWGRVAANVLMFVALVLFAASGMTTNIKRVLRHPQLTGMATWSAAHLLANGDQRGLILFGGLGLWAIAAMLFINRRDGAWDKPEPEPMAGEWKPLAAAVVGFAVLYLLHPYMAGVSASPGF